MHGFHTVEQMMFLYITQNRSPPSPDTIWIASLFLTQSFHEAEGYALYQGFLQRMMDNGTDKQIKSWAQTIHEVIHAHDPELAQHLAKCLNLCVFQSLYSYSLFNLTDALTYKQIIYHCAGGSSPCSQKHCRYLLVCAQWTSSSFKVLRLS